METLEETENGINAIIKLQEYAGFTESIESATKAWSQFTQSEKDQTTIACRVLIKKGK